MIRAFLVFLAFLLSVSVARADNYVTSHGAACDSTTDDTAALNTYLATGAKGLIPAGRLCLVSTNNLTMGAGAILEGEAGPQNNIGGIGAGSGIILNPVYSILPGAGSQMRRLLIIRQGLLTSPTAAQAIAAVTQWGSDLTTIGVNIGGNTSGAVISDAMIIGFNTCIKSSSGRFNITQVAGDCYNGVDVTLAGDNYFIDNVRMEPYYSMALPVGPSWARPGIAFNIRGGGTGAVMTRLFSFMYRNPVVFNGSGIAQLTNSTFEWHAEYDTSNVYGTVGVRRIGHNAQTSDETIAVNGFTWGESVESWGETMLANVSGGPYYLGGKTAPTETETVGGTPTVGDVITTTLSGSGCGPYAYTVISGDTLTTIASRQARQIDADQCAIAAHIQALPVGSTFMVAWPQALTITVSVSVVGTITASLAATASQPGSYGMISGADAIVVAPPMFTFAKDINAWTLLSPYVTNSATPPTGWLSIDPASTSLVTVK